MHVMRDHSKVEDRRQSLRLVSTEPDISKASGGSHTLGEECGEAVAEAGEAKEGGRGKSSKQRTAPEWPRNV